MYFKIVFVQLLVVKSKEELSHSKACLSIGTLRIKNNKMHKV